MDKTRAAANVAGMNDERRPRPGRLPASAATAGNALPGPSGALQGVARGRVGDHLELISIGVDHREQGGPDGPRLDARCQRVSGRRHQQFH